MDLRARTRGRILANSGLDENGELLSAWLLKNSRLKANVPEEHSETAYMTNRAMDFMRAAREDGRPWVCHLSYIKPHWAVYRTSALS